jgi:AraC-like DNA-binding protein
MRNSGLLPLEPFPRIAPFRIRRGNKKLLDVDAIRDLGADCGYNATELASRMGVSIRQLQRLFVRQLGCPPRAWLREERLQAAHRLVTRAVTIKEVALALSFRRESHFSRDFRSRFGYTPSTLKQTGLPGAGRPRAPEARSRAPQSRSREQGPSLLGAMHTSG